VLPYRVDVPFDTRPVLNWIVFAGVILVFCVQVSDFVEVMSEDAVVVRDPNEGRLVVEEPEIRGITKRWMLDGWSISGLFGHMWLHAGLFHLIGNLIFLWLFGNAVCSKIGNIYYLLAYLGLGLVAALSHLFFTGGAMLGASGAINGIVGMYLVFFPENSISCFLWVFYYPVRFSVSGYWIILLWFVFDLLGAMVSKSQLGGVAYVAHVGGFVGGVALAIVMLKTKLVVMLRDEKSILELLGLEKKDTPAERRGDFAHWQQEWGGEEKGPGDEKQQMQEEAPERQAAVFETQEPPERFIHFTCRCGQRVKMPGKYGGLIGRCPKCSARLKIPGGQKDIE